MKVKELIEWLNAQHQDVDVEVAVIYGDYMTAGTVTHGCLSTMAAVIVGRHGINPHSRFPFSWDARKEFRPDRQPGMTVGELRRRLEGVDKDSWIWMYTNEAKLEAYLHDRYWHYLPHWVRHLCERYFKYRWTSGLMCQVHDAGCWCDGFLIRSLTFDKGELKMPEGYIPPERQLSAGQGIVKR